MYIKYVSKFQCVYIYIFKQYQQLWSKHNLLTCFNIFQFISWMHLCSCKHLCHRLCVYTHFNIFLSPCFDSLSTWYFIFEHNFNCIKTFISTFISTSFAQHVSKCIATLFQHYLNNICFNFSYFNVFNPPGSLMLPSSIYFQTGRRTYLFGQVSSMSLLSSKLDSKVRDIVILLWNIFLNTKIFKADCQWVTGVTNHSKWQLEQEMKLA
jgi:hypothetical protein